MSYLKRASDCVLMQHIISLLAFCFGLRRLNNHPYLFEKFRKDLKSLLDSFASDLYNVETEDIPSLRINFVDEVYLDDLPF